MACAVQLAGWDRLGCVLTVFSVVGLELDQDAAGFVLFCVVGGVGRVCVRSWFWFVVCLEKLNVVGLFCDAGSEYGGPQCGIQSSSKILIKGGTVVNAHHQQIADVYVEDGIVVAVQPNINVGDDVKVLDATGKFVMPGGIDPHTHLAMEFMGSETIDDFFSGQAAALAGGTTMHIDFVIPINGSLTAGFEAYEKKAKNSCMDYGFHMAITKWDEVVSDEMEVMVKEKGINSFKFFMAYKGSFMINDELLIEGFKRCKSLGALAMVHAENGDAVFEGQKRMIELGITGPEGHALSRPPLLEGEATTRAIRLAEFVNTPLYVVHVMSMDAMEEIAKARKAGPNFLNTTIPLCDSCRQRVIGEPVVSGLVLDDSWLWHSDFVTAAKQLVGTDHCAFNSTQKAFGIDDFRKIPNGVNGIEERMHLVWDTMVESGQISVTDYVRLTSTECARIFNVYPRKGAILVGSDADIIIFNPNSSFEITARSHHSRLDTNVYEGRRVKGKVEVTIAGGRVVWENDELKAVPGSGKFIEMRPFNYLFHGLDKADAKYLSSLQAPVKRLKSST
ncbi:Dihydropyrimidinase [Citrus sinensis]|uniref:Dihydropyrimidinase n=1 Tax=Citrus sinensis TaxID=2711 RepID=A0ACB8MXG6_CITSI|nr:Dihydropyrimidinase [Citrus sinensis]